MYIYIYFEIYIYICYITNYIYTILITQTANFINITAQYCSNIGNFNLRHDRYNNYYRFLVIVNKYENHDLHDIHVHPYRTGMKCILINIKIRTDSATAVIGELL